MVAASLIHGRYNGQRQDWAELDLFFPGEYQACEHISSSPYGVICTCTSHSVWLLLPCESPISLLLCEASQQYLHCTAAH